jgi:hypothetical protein
MDDPLPLGATQDRATVPFPGVAMSPVGAEGAVGAGTTEFDGFEATPVPTEFVAVTENEYVSPSVRPTKTQLSAPEVQTHDWPPLEATVASAATTV